MLQKGANLLQDVDKMDMSFNSIASKHLSLRLSDLVVRVVFFTHLDSSIQRESNSARQFGDFSTSLGDMLCQGDEKVGRDGVDRFG